MDIMVTPEPPQDFCKRLAEYDPSLFLRWHKTHQVWSVWCRDPYTGSVDHIMNVVNDDGSFRPLDERVFMTLRANRFYAENPKLLEKKLCDDLLQDIESRRKKVRDNLKVLSKDKALQKQFCNVMEKLRGMDWNEWKKPVYVKDRNGKIVFSRDVDRNGNPIPLYRYKPDSEVLKMKHKPTMGEIDEIVKSNPRNDSR